MNHYRPLCWAFPVLADKEQEARAWLAEVNQRQSDMQQHMQAQNMRCYYAWLQSKPDGLWIVEYWETTLTIDEVRELIKHHPTPFIEWCINNKNKLHGKTFSDFKGLRRLIEYGHKSDAATQPLASIFPIKEGKLGKVITTLDNWSRDRSDELQSYSERLGIQKWQAWVEEIANQHYLLQYHFLEHSLDKVYDDYTKETSDFAKTINDFGIDCFGLDFSKAEDWQKVELMVEYHNVGE